MTVSRPTPSFLLSAGLAAFLLCGIGSCKKEESWKSHQFQQKTIRPKAHDVQIPMALWKKIEAMSGGVTTFDSLKVYLIERNKGILKSGDVALLFPNGGGELDLSDFVENKRGSFYVVFEFLPEVENAQTKIFYLSQAVSRKIGSEKVGAGCETFLDISKVVAVAAKGEGFLVNTSDQRHVSALAGTYVFASMRDGKLHLSSLIVRDSQYRALQCRR